jgi:hypothetical protein
MQNLHSIYLFNFMIIKINNESQEYLRLFSIFCTDVPVQLSPMSWQFIPLNIQLEIHPTENDKIEISIISEREEQKDHEHTQGEDTWQWQRSHKYTQSIK